MARTLPKWLYRREDGAFVVDPDIVYPLVFRLLGVKDAELTQYWIEVAYQCAKMATQDLITGTELDPRPNMGFVIIIESAGARKERWALKKYKPGTGLGPATKNMPGVIAATKAREAKEHYARIRLQLAA